MPKIFVNGRPHVIDEDKRLLKYADVVALAGLKGTPTVTYRHYASSGSMQPGAVAYVHEGDVFNASHTDNA